MLDDGPIKAFARAREGLGTEVRRPPPLPFTPGVEAAGDVVEVNAAEGVAVGDRVIVKMRHGAYSDEAVATPSQLVKLPSTSTMRRARRFWPAMAPPITR